jgi:hypothetical protein
MKLKLLLVICFMLAAFAGAVSAGQMCTTITLASDASTESCGYNETEPSISDPLNEIYYGCQGYWGNSTLAEANAMWYDASALGEGAAWISSAATTEGSTDDQWRLFKKEFNIPAGAIITSAQISYTSDNAVEVVLNGYTAGTTGYVFGPAPDPRPQIFTGLYNAQLAPSPGINTLKFILRNWADTNANPTGLLYKAVIEYCMSTVNGTDSDGDGYFAEIDDCNDLNDSIHPGAEDAACDGIDNNCDGTEDEDYASTATECGIGACANTGLTGCVHGEVVDSCLPKTTAANDSVCNGLDDDCSGIADEDYVALPTACGIGACAASGTTACINGTVVDSCIAGTPANETCNGLDDDCNALVDDGLTAPLANKQKGVCAGSIKACAGAEGWIEPNYSSLPYYEAVETRCDTLDNDCDRRVDENGVCEYHCASPKTDTEYTALGAKTHRWVFNGTQWVTIKPKGRGPKFTPSLAMTHNCGCEQILTFLHENLPEEYGEMKGHWKFGCTQGDIYEFMRLAHKKDSFAAKESSYFNGSTDASAVIGSGPIAFTWSPITHKVIGGYYTLKVPAYNGTSYYNVVTGGSVVGKTVTLAFESANAGSQNITFSGTLSRNVLKGQVDGLHYLNATGTGRH